MRASLLVLIAALSFVSNADAKCAAPRSVISPAGGAELPTEASIYLFVPGSGDQAKVRLLEVQYADGERENVAAKLTSLPSPPAFRSFRIDLWPPREGELRVAALVGRRDEQIEAVYRVRSDAAMGSRSPVAVVKVEEELRAWTCSWQATRNLTVSAAAPAYRVEWAPSDADYRSGRRQSVVVPYHMKSFFRSGGAAPLTSAGLVALGHVDCHGHTFEWGDRPIHLGIVALNADGTESAAPEMPTRVEPPSSKDGTTPKKRRGVSILELLDGKRQPD